MNYGILLMACVFGVMGLLACGVLWWSIRENRRIKREAEANRCRCKRKLKT